MPENQLGQNAGDLRVRLDPLNPAQFFACCGLFELLNLERPGLTASFSIDTSIPRCAWIVFPEVDGVNTLRELLTRLRDCEVTFPEMTPPTEPAVNPAVLQFGQHAIQIDWWLNEFRDSTENLKCWAGQVTTKNLLTELVPRIDADADGEDLFERSVMTKAKFGVDPRSAWTALGFGFSPNEHGKDSATFPATEVLAAIGLQGFRPDARRREGVRYGLWQIPMAASVARLAFRSPWNGLAITPFRFDIRKRGQSYKYFTFAENA